VIDRVKDKKRWVAGSQAEVANFFAVATDTVHAWRKKGMPGVSGRYDLREILIWLRGDGPWREREKVDHPATAQDRRREFQAQLEELKLRKELGELIPREHVHATYQELADSLRNAGDVLQRIYGEAAMEILNDALERARGSIHDRFAAQSTVDRSGDG
jgi:phage terminase Nu1 subunit (DNA packaging protein)